MKNFKSQMGDAELREHYEKMDGVARSMPVKLKRKLKSIYHVIFGLRKILKVQSNLFLMECMKK